MKKLIALLPFAMSACVSDTGQSETYGTPAWNRSYCATIIWSQQGAQDGVRYKDGEKRLAALDQVCGMHFAIPRDEYLDAFNAAKN